MKGIFYVCDFIIQQSQVCDHHTPKCDLYKIQVCDDRTAKQNKACVGVCMCDCTPLTARPACLALLYSARYFSRFHTKSGAANYSTVFFSRQVLENLFLPVSYLCSGRPYFRMMKCLGIRCFVKSVLFEEKFFSI